MTIKELQALLEKASVFLGEDSAVWYEDDPRETPACLTGWYLDSKGLVLR